MSGDCYKEMQMKPEGVAAIFPGQGSQREGMGADFCREYATARRIYAEASDAIGVDLAAISFAEDDERLHLTEFTQPAILTNEIALLEVLREEAGFAPSIFAGHSLGEYTALVAAGGLGFADAVRLVRHRGALMQSAVPAGAGAMSAVKLSPDAPGPGATACMERIAGHGVDVANINSRFQFVMSGLVAAVHAASDEIRRTVPEVEIVPLAVSAPFHSRHMREIEDEFAAYLADIALNGPACAAVLSNFTGRYHGDEADGVRRALVSQISGAVRWSENMRTLVADATELLEIGPGRPLGGFFVREGYNPPPSVVTVRCLRKLRKAAAAGA